MCKIVCVCACLCANLSLCLCKNMTPSSNSTVEYFDLVYIYPQVHSWATTVKKNNNFPHKSLSDK